jgi:hypothetical protein
MARDTGDESSEDERMTELTAIEMDFFKRFKESTKETKNVVTDWLAESKNYEKCTRAQLFAHYKVMEDRIVAILNQNKLESKGYSLPVRERMQERRGWVRTMWQKERTNYYQLDLVLQLKVDDEEFQMMFESTRKMQESTSEFLKLRKEAAVVVDHAQNDLTETSKNADKKLKKSLPLTVSDMLNSTGRSTDNDEDLVKSLFTTTNTLQKSTREALKLGKEQSGDNGNGDLDTGENHFIGFLLMERHDENFYEVKTNIECQNAGEELDDSLKWVGHQRLLARGEHYINFDPGGDFMEPDKQKSFDKAFDKLSFKSG